MSSIFGKESRPVTQPTGFGTLPTFSREAVEEAVTRGTELSRDVDLFAPPGLTGEQQAALGTLQAGLDPTSPEAFQAGLTTFGDPFEEQVVQSAISDILRTGAGQLSDIGTMASAAGGFGGTRQALLESELQSNLLRNIGDVSGQLRSSGFQAAADRTLGDIARQQDVAGTLFGLGEQQRLIQQQQQQAPLSAVSYLSNLATAGIPTGGGTTSYMGGSPGMLGAIGDVASGLGSFGTGFGFGG